MTAGPSAAADLPTPGLARRLAGFVYEGVLLFGVLMAAGLLYGVLTEQRHALEGAIGLRVFLFIVLGLYFVGFWTARGQTLAMQTWHLRLVTRAGAPVPWGRALCRYLLAWLWFVPGLLLLSLAGLRGAAPAFAVIGTGVLAYASLAWLNRDRQYLHDVVCGTRLVTWRPPPGPGPS